MDLLLCVIYFFHIKHYGVILVHSKWKYHFFPCGTGSFLSKDCSFVQNVFCCPLKIHSSFVNCISLLIDYMHLIIFVSCCMKFVGKIFIVTNLTVCDLKIKFRNRTSMVLEFQRIHGLWRSRFLFLQYFCFLFLRQRLCILIYLSHRFHWCIHSVLFADLKGLQFTVYHVVCSGGKS